MKFFKWLGKQLFPDNFTCELCGKEIFDGGRFCEDFAPSVTYKYGNT